MQVGGAVAPDVGREPGHAVAVLAGDLVAALGGRARRVAAMLVREVTGVVRARRPVVGALVTSVRAMPRVVVPAPRLAPRHPQVAGPAARRGSGERCSTRCHTAVLPADPTAPRRARDVLQSAAAEWAIDGDLHHDAAMVVTELVANAVDHARTPSTLTVDLDGGGVYVAVRDGRPGQSPRPAPIDPRAPRGRGLQMVDALAAAWGVTTDPHGKTVWAVLARS